jgi:hypothetical protein
MNKVAIAPNARVQLAIALSIDESSEHEWASVLDCGALGPSRNEPKLFHQRRRDSAHSALSAAKREEEVRHV